MDNVRYQPLPNDLYTVRVPAICTYTPAERELYGLPMDTIVNVNTGATSHNHSAYNNFVTCMLTLDRIIDIYINGYPIYLVDKEDIHLIYKALDHYVSGYNHMEKVSPNAGVIEDNRIYRIEEFLKEIFGWNKGDILTGLTKGNTNGWNVDIPLLRVAPTTDVINVNISPQENRKVGVLAGYENPTPPRTYGYEQNQTPGLNNYNQPMAVMNVHTIDTGSLNANTPKTNDYMQIFEQAPQIDLTKVEFTHRYRKIFK